MRTITCIVMEKCVLTDVLARLWTALVLELSLVESHLLRGKTTHAFTVVSDWIFTMQHFFMQPGTHHCRAGIHMTGSGSQTPDLCFCQPVLSVMYSQPFNRITDHI